MTDPLSDIRHYSQRMTISQVLKFCEKKSLAITRGMIQNYIRDGLLPPPADKRFYTQKHLAALVLIDRLKTVFDIPTIKQALAPFIDGEGLPLELYFGLIGKTNDLTREWLSLDDTFKNEPDGGTLLAMACAAELKAVIGPGSQFAEANAGSR